MAKRVPMRMCTGCREMKPKAELVRVVKSPEGGISLDLVGKAPGRGAYVCASSACLKRSRKTRALERVFSSPVSDELEAALLAQMPEETLDG